MSASVKSSPLGGRRLLCQEQTRQPITSATFVSDLDERLCEFTFIARLVRYLTSLLILHTTGSQDIIFVEPDNTLLDCVELVLADSGAKGGGGGGGGEGKF